MRKTLFITVLIMVTLLSGCGIFDCETSLKQKKAELIKITHLSKDNDSYLMVFKTDRGEITLIKNYMRENLLVIGQHYNIEYTSKNDSKCDGSSLLNIELAR